MFTFFTSSRIAKVITLLSAVLSLSILSFAFSGFQVQEDYGMASLLLEEGVTADLSIEALDEFFDGSADDFLDFDLEALVDDLEATEFQDDLSDLQLYHSNGELMAWSIFYKLLAEKENADIRELSSRPEDQWFAPYEEWFRTEYSQLDLYQAFDPVDGLVALDLYGDLPPGAILSEKAIDVEELLLRGVPGEIIDSVDEFQDQSFDELLDIGYGLEDVLSLIDEPIDPLLEEVQYDGNIEIPFDDLEVFSKSPETLIDELIDDNLELKADTYELLYGLDPSNNPLFSEIIETTDFDEEETDKDELTVSKAFEDFAELFSEDFDSLLDL